METQGFLRQFWLSWHNRKEGEVPGTTLLQFNPLRKDLKMNEALHHTERLSFGNDLNLWTKTNTKDGAGQAILKLLDEAFIGRKSFDALSDAALDSHYFLECSLLQCWSQLFWNQ